MRLKSCPYLFVQELLRENGVRLLIVTIDSREIV
jgi:hypothetical protein